MAVVTALLVATLAAPVVTLSPGLILAELVENKTSDENSAQLWHFNPNDIHTPLTRVRTVRGGRQENRDLPIFGNFYLSKAVAHCSCSFTGNDTYFKRRGNSARNS